MPSAVIGLTKHDAPSACVVPSGNAMHCDALTQRYCEYIAPPKSATVRPSNACASADDPASTTTPAPSLPTGTEWPTRPATAFMRSFGICAVTRGAVDVPPCRAVLISAPANIRPWSEGLIGL